MRALLTALFLVATADVSAGASWMDREYMKEWLVCGPFPSPARSESDDSGRDPARLGFDIDYLEVTGGESAAKPKSGDSVRHASGDARWVKYASPSDVVDFLDCYGEGQMDNVVAYACGTFESDFSGPAALFLGSDDSVKVYLNGKLVHDKCAGRAVRKDEDRVPLMLRKGSNRLLIKVENTSGGWSFVAKVMREEEVRMRDKFMKALSGDVGDAIEIARRTHAGMSKKGAVAALEKCRSYRDNSAYEMHSDAERVFVIGKCLAVADQLKGKDGAAEALLAAARGNTGRCQSVPENDAYRCLGENGWDRAIEIYSRVIKEHPGTAYAKQAKWWKAACYGQWARCGCCRANQGKGEWEEAIAMYRDLYEASKEPGAKLDALRRIGEMQCLVRTADRGRFNADVGIGHIQGTWREGLATMRRIFAEFLGDTPPSPYYSSTACGVMNGRDNIDYFLIRFSLGPLLEHAGDAKAAQDLYDEYIELAPPFESVKFHGLIKLKECFSRLGATERAEKIEDGLGLADSWLVIGPFDAGYPEDSLDERFGRKYGPEKDWESGKLDLSRIYEAPTMDGAAGRAAWCRADTIVAADLFARRGVFYALTRVDSVKKQGAELKMGACGRFKAWLNGKEVYSSAQATDWPLVDQHTTFITLEPGKNELVLKFAPYNGFDAAVRITDSAGVALSGVGYAVPDVPEKNERAANLFMVALRVDPKEAAEVRREFTHGFRRDPMEYVRRNRSGQAALVRKLVFGKPLAGDEDLIEKEYRGILAGQKEDGTFPDPHDQGTLASTAETLLRLLRIGFPADAPETLKALAALEKALGELPAEKQDGVSCYALEALSMLGRTGHPAVKKSLLKLAQEMDDLLGQGCPGTPCVQLSALHAGRKVADVDAAIEKGLAYLDRHLLPTACSEGLGLLHPASLARLITAVNHPRTRSMAEKMVPHFLRRHTWNNDWDWDFGERHLTLVTFQILKKHGLLAALHGLPPLPPDWEVVRSIPVPSEAPSRLFFREGKFWTLDADKWEAVAVSAATGKEAGRVPMPEGIKPDSMFGSSFGPWGDDFAIAVKGKSVYRLDGKTGKLMDETPIPFIENFADAVMKVEKDLIISDGWDGCLWRVRPGARAKPVSFRITSNMTSAMCMEGKDIWAVDHWAGVIAKSNVKGDLLEWGEHPFWVGGLAHDGKQLWLLNLNDKTICAVRKTKSGNELALRWE